jgi:hypothetical protein
MRDCNGSQNGRDRLEGEGEMTGPVLRKKIPTEKLVPYCGSEETGELFGRAYSNILDRPNRKLLAVCPG